MKVPLENELIYKILESGKKQKQKHSFAFCASAGETVDAC